MGIKNFNTLIKQFCPNAKFVLPITAFKNKRIAIDSSLWMRANMYTAREIVINRTTTGNVSTTEITREWLILALNFINKWISFQITPIFVFDGKPPDEKREELELRAAKDIAQLSKIKNLQDSLKNLTTMTQSLEEDTEDLSNNNFNIMNEFKKEFPKYTKISSDDHKTFVTVLESINVKCVKAKNEAEQLCSMLYREGKVAGVYSKDTDNLVYGCNLLMTKFSKPVNNIPMLECIRLDKILEGTKLSFKEFVDLCIMAGCDNNKNMPGYAMINSYKLLLQHRSIDNLPAKHPVSILNHIRCRELFQYVHYKELIQNVEFEESVDMVDDILFKMNKNIPITAKSVLDNLWLANQLSRLTSVYNLLEPSEDGYVEINSTKLNTDCLFPRKRLVLNVVNV
jgi:flap endonuclease-1